MQLHQFDVRSSDWGNDVSDVMVETTAGRLQGTEADGIKNFKGVPYAAPPIGRNRFRAPQPVEAWTGLREALAYGASAPQPTQRPAGWSQEVDSSEDCLYLNVWTPALDGARRPVLFWIHGGGYSIGSGSWPLYDGTALARRGDVVVVTVNHRLGALGYLHLGEIAGDEFAASGNNGNLDLVAALEWVRDNIANFGGDPGNVTVFGESGGGAKISCLLAMPSARGLFHRAAIQSGPGLRVSSVERATRSAQAVLESLGIDDGDVERLWSLPAHDFVGAGGGMAMLGPVLDGTVMPAHPADALADGTAIDVPVLIGCNKDEALRGLPAELDDAGLRERLEQFGQGKSDEILAVYRGLFPDASNVEILSYVTTDSGMRAGSIRLAEQKLKGTTAPVWMYFFTYEMGGRAGHGYEIQFVFDNVREPIAHTSATRQLLADQMSEAWIAFARDGDPGHAGLPKWPSYTLPDRSTMVFGRGESVVIDDPSGPARELWQQLPPVGRRR